MKKLTLLLLLFVLAMGGCAPTSSNASGEPVKTTPFTLNPDQSIDSDDLKSSNNDLALQPTQAPEITVSPNSAGGTPLEAALSLSANPPERHFTPISNFRFFRFTA